MINPSFRNALNGIKCGDGEDDTQLSFDEIEEYVNELKAQSSTLGAEWATIRFRCTGWFIRPNYRFEGPFTTPTPGASGTDETRPAAPLLFMSSRLEPVTPLRNAVSMAAAHPDTAWVVQESMGHSTIILPSRCSQSIVREYLEHGTVPESGTQCPADCDPWHPCDATGISTRDVHFKFGETSGHEHLDTVCYLVRYLDQITIGYLYIYRLSCDNTASIFYTFKPVYDCELLGEHHNQ
jgi:hypothetical protein